VADKLFGRALTRRSPVSRADQCGTRTSGAFLLRWDGGVACWQCIALVIEALAMARSPFSIPVAPTNSLLKSVSQTTGHETATGLSYRFTGNHRA